MLSGAAVCPHPPALIPEVGGVALAEVAGLAVAVVRRLVGTAPDVIVVVGGPDPHLVGEADETSLRVPAWLDGSSGGTTDRFGVRSSVGGAGADPLPLPGLIGCWLLDRAGWTGPRRFLTVPSGYPGAECSALGAALGEGDARVALLAMGDGSSSRTRTSPSAFRPEATAFDDEVFQALSAPAPDRLLALDSGVAARVGAAGLAAWQVLAGALVATVDPVAWQSEAAQLVTTFPVAYLLSFLRPAGPAAEDSPTS